MARVARWLDTYVVPHGWEETPVTPQRYKQLSSLIWSVAEYLRGPYRPPQYERVMLPLTVLRRLDAVLAPTKKEVLARYQGLKGKSESVIDSSLGEIPKGPDGAPLGFHNHSPLDFGRLRGDPDRISANLKEYIHSFSKNIREIFTDYFRFEAEIDRLEEADRLYQLVTLFDGVDLSPGKVDSIMMGHVFEDLIRDFNEKANETAGDHFTPREVIRLMVNLILSPDRETLTKKGKIVTVFDPACGTGGMLAESERWIREHNGQASAVVHGQDISRQSYAIAKSDLLIKGSRGCIKHGDTLTDDKFEGERYDYMLANPPFGVNWKTAKDAIDLAGSFRNYSGKLPRVSDGALLFLIHMLSKCRPWVKGSEQDTGSRLAIVFNGSPLFTGGAGSGESEIRRWVIEEHDWLEAIIALPEQMFYNTSIGTFVWVLSNRKEVHRKGRIQLIDAREKWTQMQPSLGNKRRYLTDEQIDEITHIHDGNRAEDSKTFDRRHFGYRSVTIQRPLRLRFEMTPEARRHFLDTYPELCDSVMAIEEALGGGSHFDWNQVWAKAQQIIKDFNGRYGEWAKGAQGTAQKQGFRKVFTQRDPEAEPVIAKHHKTAAVPSLGELFPMQEIPELDDSSLARLLGFYPARDGGFVEYEKDTSLKDSESIPLLDEDVVSYVQREVLPHWPDAWIDGGDTDEKDGGIGKVGYEINFHREFFQPEELRPLEDINADLAKTGKELVELMGRLSK